MHNAKIRAYVGELSVFEDLEVVFCAELLERLDKIGIKILDDVHMCLTRFAQHGVSV